MLQKAVGSSSASSWLSMMAICPVVIKWWAGYQLLDLSSPGAPHRITRSVRAGLSEERVLAPW